MCRTGTHLFAFARYVEQFRGWGRSLRRGVGAWYAGQTPERLAYQAVKYRQREGTSHRDLLRLAHPGAKTRAGNPRLPVTDEHARLFEWIVRGGETAALPQIVTGFVAAQNARTATRGGRASSVSTSSRARRSSRSTSTALRSGPRCSRACR